MTPIVPIGTTEKVVREFCAQAVAGRLVALSLVVLQQLRWRCPEWAVCHERNVRDEKHYIICGANKQ